MLKLKAFDMSAEPEKTSEALKKLPDIIPVRFHKKKNGNVFPTEISVKSFKINDRKVVAVSIRDITERFSMEEKLKESKNRFKRLSESGKEGIVFHDNAIVIDANEAAR